MDPEQREEVALRATPHVLRLFTLLKLVLGALICMRAYKLGQNVRQLRVQQRLTKGRQAKAAAARADASAAGKADTGSAGKPDGKKAEAAAAAPAGAPAADQGTVKRRLKQG